MTYAFTVFAKPMLGQGEKETREDIEGALGDLKNLEISVQPSGWEAILSARRDAQNYREELSKVQNENQRLKALVLKAKLIQKRKLDK